MEGNSEGVIFDAPPRWQGFAGAAFAIAIFLIFASSGYEGRGRIVAVSFVAVVASTRICWPLRGKMWFWVLMTIILIAHLLVVFGFSWSNERYPAFTLIPIMVADIAVILGIVALTNKTMRG